MKLSVFSLTKILAVLTASAALTALPLSAHEGHKHSDDNANSLIKADAAGVSAEWLAKAQADYPIDSCAVSGDKFDGGDMGKPQDYVYKQQGKPDRLVRFCCKDCVKDFNQDPAKYLKVLDEAAAAKAKATHAEEHRAGT